MWRSTRARDGLLKSCGIMTLWWSACVLCGAVGCSSLSADGLSWKLILTGPTRPIGDGSIGLQLSSGRTTEAKHGLEQ